MKKIIIILVFLLLNITFVNANIWEVKMNNLSFEKINLSLDKDDEIINYSTSENWKINVVIRNRKDWYKEFLFKDWKKWKEYKSIDYMKCDNLWKDCIYLVHKNTNNIDNLKWNSKISINKNNNYIIKNGKQIFEWKNIEIKWINFTKRYFIFSTNIFNEKEMTLDKKYYLLIYKDEKIRVIYFKDIKELIRLKFSKNYNNIVLWYRNSKWEKKMSFNFKELENEVSDFKFIGNKLYIQYINNIYLNNKKVTNIDKWEDDFFYKKKIDIDNFFISQDWKKVSFIASDKKEDYNYEYYFIKNWIKEKSYDYIWKADCDELLINCIYVARDIDKNYIIVKNWKEILKTSEKIKKLIVSETFSSYSYLKIDNNWDYFVIKDWIEWKKYKFITKLEYIWNTNNINYLASNNIYMSAKNKDNILNKNQDYYYTFRSLDYFLIINKKEFYNYNFKDILKNVWNNTFLTVWNTWEFWKTTFIKVKRIPKLDNKKIEKYYIKIKSKRLLEDNLKNNIFVKYDKKINIFLKKTKIEKLIKILNKIDNFDTKKLSYKNKQLLKYLEWKIGLFLYDNKNIKKDFIYNTISFRRNQKEFMSYLWTIDSESMSFWESSYVSIELNDIKILKNIWNFKLKKISMQWGEGADYYTFYYKNNKWKIFLVKIVWLPIAYGSKEIKNKIPQCDNKNYCIKNNSLSLKNYYISRIDFLSENENIEKNEKDRTKKLFMNSYIDLYFWK